MAEVGFAGAVEALHGVVDQLLASDLALLPSAELPGLFAALETERRRLEAVDHNLVAALDERGIAGEYGRTSTADLLTELSRVVPGEARARGCGLRVISDRGARCPVRRWRRCSRGSPTRSVTVSCLRRTRR